MGKHKEAIKQAIKNELLEKFRVMRTNDQDQLSSVWLFGDFLPSLSVKEERALEEALGEMIADGLIEYVSGPKPNYKLTHLGAQTLI